MSQGTFFYEDYPGAHRFGQPQCLSTLIFAAEGGVQNHRAALFKRHLGQQQQACVG